MKFDATKTKGILIGLIGLGLAAFGMLLVVMGVERFGDVLLVCGIALGFVGAGVHFYLMFLDVTGGYKRDDHRR